MLLRLSAENYYSFADRFEIKFDLTSREEATTRGWTRTAPNGSIVTTAMAVMGANGAGKTTMVKVAPFLAWFVNYSFSAEPQEVMPILPHQVRASDPMTFEVDLAYGDSVWTYELVADTQQVLWECLRRKRNTPGSRSVDVFTRKWSDEKITYDVVQTFGMPQAEAEKVRPNVSFIAWAKQYGVKAATDAANAFIVTSNIDDPLFDIGSSENLIEAGGFFHENPDLYEAMRTQVRRLDLGLKDVALHKFSPSEDEKSPLGQSRKERWYPAGVHSARGRQFELPFVLESNGTQKAFLILHRILPVLARGGVVFIDEFDNHLHPDMIEPLLRLFHDEQSNPHGAQIMFTCQSDAVLDLLHRAQVMFVEKRECESVAYRGNDIEGLTSGHNLRAKYRAGALGAVPQV